MPQEKPTPVGLPGPEAKATGVPNFQGAYRNTGLFGVCDTEAQLVTAFVGGGPSIIDDITWNGTEMEWTKWEALVDITQIGNQPATDCEPCQRGELEVCELDTCFGQYCKSTPEVSLLKVGTKVPGAVERQLVGNLPMMPESMRLRGRTLSPAEIMIVGLGYNLRREVQVQAWQGNAGATTPPGYEQMNGLARLVNTGLVDSFNGQACGALDSDMKPYNACIGHPGAPNIVAYFAAIKRHIDFRWSRAGMDPDVLQRAIYMRRELWDCVAAAWPISYYAQAAGVTIGAGRVFMYQDERQRTMYDRIIDTQMLPIDGEWFPVRFDSGILGTYGGGDGNRFHSDIYFLTLRAGNSPVIYGEYQNFDATIRSLVTHPAWKGIFSSGIISIIDGGRFLTHVNNVYVCVDAHIWTRPRILVKMPWLQGRITDVCCDLLQPYPGPDYPGFVPGGRRVTPAHTRHGPCA